MQILIIFDFNGGDRNDKKSPELQSNDLLMKLAHNDLLALLATAEILLDQEM
jgi:hypothetical protein